MIPCTPFKRQPKGDDNRRLSLGIALDDFANRTGLAPEQVRAYEMTGPDHDFDPQVAQRYGEALERLQANLPASKSVKN